MNISIYIIYYDDVVVDDVDDEYCKWTCISWPMGLALIMFLQNW